ncbi:Olfactory receptor 52N2 [Vulpes lagopus]
MHGDNSSSLTPRYFILNGIPELEALHTWISLPFCFMYIITVLGNCGLIYLISHEEALHRPMYYFLALLSLTDVSVCTSFVPNMLCIFWFNLKEIDFNACLVQMFFIHMLTGMESSVLMLMALDLYGYGHLLPSMLFYHPHQNGKYQSWVCPLQLKCVAHDPIHFPD